MGPIGLKQHFIKGVNNINLTGSMIKYQEEITVVVKVFHAVNDGFEYFIFRRNYKPKTCVLKKER